MTKSMGTQPCVYCGKTLEEQRTEREWLNRAYEHGPLVEGLGHQCVGAGNLPIWRSDPLPFCNITGVAR